MLEVNIQEARTHLSRLLKRVAKGEEIIISRAGRPVAWLVPFTSAAKKRKPLFDPGKVILADNFEDFPPEYMLRRSENG